jgi:hypothetical protein
MRPRTFLTLLLVLLLFQLAASSASAAATGERPSTASSPVVSLSGPISDERTTSYWAYAVEPDPVRSAPSPRSRVIDSIRLWTEDGFAATYLVLAQQVFPHQTWFKVRLPGRPNGRTGWIPEQALGELHVTHKHLVVDERRLHLTLYLWGKRIFSAPVGIGKPATPTPTGDFWIREKFRVQSDPFYGPYAFGTSDYSTLSEWPHGGVVGIHGTNEPSLIPGAPSHGCIRMKNSDIARLWPLLSVGTPLTIT